MRIATMTMPARPMPVQTIYAHTPQFWAAATAMMNAMIVILAQMTHVIRNRINASILKADLTPTTTELLTVVMAARMILRRRSLGTAVAVSPRPRIATSHLDRTQFRDAVEVLAALELSRLLLSWAYLDFGVS